MTRPLQCETHVILEDQTDPFTLPDALAHGAEQ